MSEEGESSLKRPNGKNVSWPSDDKLCQVRLFAAEDAPSLSGSTLQEFYQAKQTRFMHTVVPISLDDLPPGFEGVAVKREALDAEGIAALVAQIPWRCPAKYELVPSWQVVAGDESTEVTEQCERDVRVLEAIYPRTSTIPPSPAEPPDDQGSNGNADIPELPLVPVEDEEEYTEEGVVTDNIGSDGNRIYIRQSSNSSGQDSRKTGSGSATINMFNQSLGAASLLKDADLNVAAAAAAAYAAVKATECGRMIDHDLLVKILSNPVLLETLSVASEKIRNQSLEHTTSSANRVGMNGHCGKLSDPLAGGQFNSQSMPTKITSLHDIQRFNAPEGWILQGDQGPPGFVGWNVPAGGGSSAIMSEKTFAAPVTHELPTGLGIGNGSGPFSMTSLPISQNPAIKPQLITQAVAPSSNLPMAPRQDYLKGLIHQHGMAKGNFGHVTSVVPDECKRSLNIERFRPMNVGSLQDPPNSWLGNDRTQSFPLRNLREDGVEPMRAKFRKTCIYFNTPRGCRNGSNCLFLHESNIEKNRERTRIDIPQPEQVKRPRFETSSDIKN